MCVCVLCSAHNHDLPQTPWWWMGFDVGWAKCGFWWLLMFVVDGDGECFLWWWGLSFDGCGLDF